MLFKLFSTSRETLNEDGEETGASRHEEIKESLYTSPQALAMSHTPGHSYTSFTSKSVSIIDQAAVRDR